MTTVARIGDRVAIPIYNVYGFPGDHGEKSKAARANAILEAAIQKVVDRGDRFVAIVG